MVQLLQKSSCCVPLHGALVFMLADAAVASFPDSSEEKEVHCFAHTLFNQDFCKIYSLTLTSVRYANFSCINPLYPNDDYSRHKYRYR